MSEGSKLRKLYIAILLSCSGAGLHASTYQYFASSTNACKSGEPCDAAASFAIVDSSHFSITLYDTLAPITDAGQLLTGFEFSLGGPGTTVTMTGSSANFFDVNKNGVPVGAGSGATGWGFGANGAPDQWLLCVVCSKGVTDTAPPNSQGIITNQASYAGADSSIINARGPHQVFLASGAVFTFSTNFTLTPDSPFPPFGNIVFSFGTSKGTEVDGELGGTIQGAVFAPSTVSPEPVTVVLAAAGLLALGLLKRAHLNF